MCKESGQKGLNFFNLMSVWDFYFLEAQIVSHVCVNGLNNNVSSFCTEVEKHTFSDLFSLRNWRRKLHIWSPNYTSTLALHELRKWLRFGYAIATSVIRFSFLMRSYFLTRPPCSKGMWACLWYAPIKSCNIDAGFGANIGSERSRNSLQLGENVWAEEAGVWSFFRRN